MSISPADGFCVKTLSGETKELTGYEWTSFNDRALKMSPESFGEIKIILLKLCKKQKDCDFESVKKRTEEIQAMLN